MVSTLFELAGFASLSAASYVAGGLIALLVVVGVELLVVGFALDGGSQVLRRHVKRSGR